MKAITLFAVCALAVASNHVNVHSDPTNTESMTGTARKSYVTPQESNKALMYRLRHLQSNCGNEICDYPTENCNNCAADCVLDLPQTCGDGVCSGTEDCNNCLQDCFKSRKICCAGNNCNSRKCNRRGYQCGRITSCCGDETCEGNETPQNCAADCSQSTPAPVTPPTPAPVTPPTPAPITPPTPAPITPPTPAPVTPPTPAPVTPPTPAPVTPPTPAPVMPPTPAPFTPPNTFSKKTITYGVDDQQTQVLDLYTPDYPATSTVATVIHAHGGLWQGGDKGGSDATLCQNIVQRSGRSIACASINYRLSASLGGNCNGDKITYKFMLADFTQAYAKLQEVSPQEGLDTTKMYIAGHSAGGHLAHELNLLWDKYACANCDNVAGAIGYEGIYDIRGWDDYDDSVWGDGFDCAARKAFGKEFPSSDGEYDDEYSSYGSWDIGSPTFLVQNRASITDVNPTGNALIIQSPGDDWVDKNDPVVFGAELSSAYNGVINVITETNGFCTNNEGHNQVLSTSKLADCIINFVISDGSSIV